MMKKKPKASFLSWEMFLGVESLQIPSMGKEGRGKNKNAMVILQPLRNLTDDNNMMNLQWLFCQQG